MNGWHKLGTAAALSLTLAACTTAPDEKTDAYAEVLAEMDRCAAEHGYRSAEYLALEPHQLAPGEAAWRACVHDGIRRNLMPRALRPEAYGELIAADEAMTAGIAAGQVTRAEREARLGEMLGAIEAEEERARQAKLARELERLQGQEAHQRLIEQMRRIQQHASEMRRRLRAR